MVMDVVIPTWVYPILIWTIAWKAVGAWHAARDNNLIWFISFFIFNTFGVLPIVYIFFFRKVDFSEKPRKKVKKNVVRKRKAPSLVK
jgi:methionyl-tRNA synthetase